MTSIFSFMRQPAATENEPAGTPSLSELAARGIDTTGSAAMTGSGLTSPVNLQPHITRLLNILGDYLPAQGGGMPKNTVSLAALVHRSLGLGGRRGMFATGQVDIAELRGGWLDGTVRFDLWGVDLPTVNELATTVQAALFSDGLNLRRRGILQLKLVAAADQGEGAPTRWHKTLDYKVLYEYRFTDVDGAASLIARIPIEGETDDTPIGTTLVTDRMVRWDDAGAPVLEVIPAPRGTVTLYGLAIAAYLPAGAPPGQVTQTLRQDGGETVTTSASLTDFLGRFRLASTLLTLIFPPQPLAPGEIQELRDYQVGELRFTPPAVLKGGTDLFRLSFSAPGFPPTNQSVVYLRALAR